MSHLLDPLDPGFLNTLGHQGTLKQFSLLLEPPDPGTQEPLRRLRWQSSVSPEQRIAASPGVSLMFQRVQPHVQPEQTQWGLRGLALHTELSPISDEPWAHAWPANLPAQNTTLQDAIAVFGEPQVKLHGLAVFSLQGPQNQTLGLQCQFDEAGYLQIFTVAHVGPWLPLPEAPPEPAAEVDEPSTALPPATCFSGGTVGKTGWYEGLLPDDHPGRALYSGTDARFVYREAGQRMTTLGVEPSRDEALVVWTWRGEQHPQ